MATGIPTHDTKEGDRLGVIRVSGSFLVGLMRHENEIHMRVEYGLPGNARIVAIRPGAHNDEWELLVSGVAPGEYNPAMVRRDPPQWISAAERLPDTNRRVLVYVRLRALWKDAGPYRIARFDRCAPFGWFSERSDESWYAEDVTHWMELFDPTAAGPNPNGPNRESGK